MTLLSVNINKIALLRNSRGRNYPDVDAFAARFLDLGAAGITLHPRQDQRHARYEDVASLQRLCAERGRELNVEGYPVADFLEVVKSARPAQCTLVPDMPGQLTSDHGWDIERHAALLRPAIAQLNDLGIRVSLFVDADYPALEWAREVGATRVELYTERFAESHGSEQGDAVFDTYLQAARRAQALGLGVNAGHDLDLHNLARFLDIPGILEVSIGHALTVEALQFGFAETIRRYNELLDRVAAKPRVFPQVLGDEDAPLLVRLNFCRTGKEKALETPCLRNRQRHNFLLQTVPFLG